jgi:hypothetical protein
MMQHGAVHMFLAVRLEAEEAVSPFSHLKAYSGYFIEKGCKMARVSKKRGQIGSPLSKTGDM